MNNSQVSHLWANGTYGKTGSNLFSESDGTIYSYGRHFPIARHTGNPLVPILITNRDYSRTTARHISEVRRAIPRGTVTVSVEDPTAYRPHTHLHNVQTLIADTLEIAIKSTRARAGGNKEWLAGQVPASLASIALYMKAFGVKLRDLQPDSRKALKRLQGEGWETIAAEMKEAADKAEKIKRAKLIKENRERLAKWLSGESDARPSHTDSIHLRVKGERVETSAGAQVTCKTALALFALCTRQRVKGLPWSGEPPFVVDHFELRSIAANGDCIVGCHSLAYAEMQRIESAVESALGIVAI